MNDIINVDEITNKETLLQYREKLLNITAEKQPTIKSTKYQIILPQDTKTLQNKFQFMALCSVDRNTNFKRLQTTSKYNGYSIIHALVHPMRTTINIEIINQKKEKHQRILTPFSIQNSQESMDKIA